MSGFVYCCFLLPLFVFYFLFCLLVFCCCYFVVVVLGFRLLLFLFSFMFFLVFMGWAVFYASSSLFWRQWGPSSFV